MADGNCLHSAVSVGLIGNNSLMYTLRILTSTEMFLNCEFYSRHTVLIDVYRNGKTVLGERDNTSFNSVFEIARRLQPIEIGNKNGDLAALVKNEAKLTCTIRFGQLFFCVLALSSVICQAIHLFYSECGFIKYEKIFNQLIYPREKSNSNCKQMIFLVLTNSGGPQKMLS